MKLFGLNSPEIFLITVIILSFLGTKRIEKGYLSFQNLLKFLLSRDNDINSEKAKAEEERIALEKAKAEEERIALEKAKAKEARKALRKAKAEEKRIALEKAKAEEQIIEADINSETI